jgi:3-oxoacyl-[acyl-carrier protein] reductase
MDLQLSGKRALVTGSSSGIGENIAKTLAQEGAIVAIHGRKEEQVNRVVAEIEENGGKAVVAIGDISTDEGAHQVADSIFSSLGEIDILVNNAGTFQDRGWMDTPTQAWADTYNINVISLVRMVQLFVPIMKPLGWGRIIQIATALATQPFSIRADYTATKAAILNLTVSLAKELAETGITVNAISPGLIITPSAKKMFTEVGLAQGWGQEWTDIEKHLLQKDWPNPSGRLGKVEDIANCVTYIASPLSGYINSVNIRVDGGGVGVVS